VIAQRPDPNFARYLRHVKKAVDVPTGAFLGASLQLLLSGDSRAAAEGFQKVKETVLAHPKEFDANFLPIIRGYLAVSYLRLGEQANCCNMYGAQSCLLPIKGSGIHQDKEGSRNAIREYLELLETNPGDLTSRWLLNLAYMTLGEHPEKVPAKWLIPEEKFSSEGAFPRFVNIAPSLNLGPPALAGGAVMDDFNSDGSSIFSLVRRSRSEARSTVLFKMMAMENSSSAQRSRTRRADRRDEFVAGRLR
jgi:hypothetical protein